MTDNTECNYCGLLMSTCQARKCCKKCSHEIKIVKLTDKSMTDNSKIARSCTNGTFIANHEDRDLIEERIIAAFDERDAAHAKVEKDLDDVLLVQKNSLDNPYMVGLYNGMLLAKSLFGHDYHPVNCPVDAKIARLTELVKEGAATLAVLGVNYATPLDSNWESAKEVLEKFLEELK